MNKENKDGLTDLVGMMESQPTSGLPQPAKPGTRIAQDGKPVTLGYEAEAGYKPNTDPNKKPSKWFMDMFRVRS